VGRDGGPDVVVIRVRGMAITDKFLVTGSGGAGNAIAIWDLSTLALVKQFSPVRGSPSIYALLVNGKFIFSATYANTIDIWDMETGQTVDKLIGHSAAVYSLCLLSEFRLVSCSYDGTIRIWDLRTNRCIQNLIRQKTSLECVAAHPDGKQFYSAASDGTISAYGPVPIAENI
jgi:WD40 repeat protein